MKIIMIVISALIWITPVNASDTDALKKTIELYADMDNTYDYKGLKNITHKAFTLLCTRAKKMK